MKRIACLIAVLAVSSPAFAQSISIPAGGPEGPHYFQDFLSASVAQPSPGVPPVARTLSLAGPRFGITLLSDDTIAKLSEHDIDVRSPIAQFGWQFEHEFYGKQDGPTVLNEWVLLLGGLDQGVAIPSLNWLVGLRTKEGTEFGIGPNITPAGVALALAAGVTLRAGVI